ncbi:hypothetical protein O181_012551 [Austropuccinia psidii MF-1]|uniref:Uncharacterized protein n=1 Tax=Austropuccinia psidii MF-1 TaxID=1389203 RepID=A0A9Q3BY12_9BASI|nr:hypothetical protein [Austropuccinia psidii MF-1]
MFVCCVPLPTMWPENFPREDSFVVGNDEIVPECKWTMEPQAGRQERFRKISLVPSSIYFPTPLLNHHSMVTSLLDRSKVIIRPMKDGNGKRTFELGLIVTHRIQTPKTKTNKSPSTRFSCSLYALQAVTTLLKDPSQLVFTEIQAYTNIWPI